MAEEPFVAVRAFHYDIQLDQGADFCVPVEFYDGGNRPIRFAGFSARMQVRKTPSSSVVIDELSSLAPNPRITFASNVMRLTWTHEQTEKIPHGRYFYDLEVTAPNGQRSRLLEGAFIIRREVTR